MWGHYSARGPIGMVTIRAALTGPAWALHSIVGWVTAPSLVEKSQDEHEGNVAVITFDNPIIGRLATGF